ncbi:MAG: aspartate carbamoyltransferase catalytic subunit, partial [Planctomycetia bacterium]|nr:aspartate carbamoyltransferase catalytic subunit [Planctomycetia bacterium]
KTPQALSGETVALMFFEPSTRTAISFRLAARRLGAEVVEVSPGTSSAQKGETLLDTVRNIEAMGATTFVIRHGEAEVPHKIAAGIGASVINAGGGANEHPTQALLDIYTLRQMKGRIKGLTVALVGDILHSRVARSNLYGLQKLGARVIFVGPPALLPRRFEEMGCEISRDLDAVLPRCDAVNMLRVQFERHGKKVFPTRASREAYKKKFQLNGRRLKCAQRDIIVMHPGPMNRGIEITDEVADGPRSAILRQVSNGVAVRMAVLSLLARANR